VPDENYSENRIGQSIPKLNRRKKSGARNEIFKALQVQKIFCMISQRKGSWEILLTLENASSPFRSCPDSGGRAG
jgi:hypothetical protein